MQPGCNATATPGSSLAMTAREKEGRGRREEGGGGGGRKGERKREKRGGEEGEGGERGRRGGGGEGEGVRGRRGREEGGVSTTREFLNHGYRQRQAHEFLGKFVTDLGATVAAGNVVIGHHLGLYKALADGPASADELAARTETSPRYIAEWLRGQAAGGYVEYDPADDTYSMTEDRRSR